MVSVDDIWLLFGFVQSPGELDQEQGGGAGWMNRLAAELFLESTVAFRTLCL